MTKCLAAMYDSLPNPKANTGDQGDKTLNLPSTKVLRKIACGVQLTVGNSTMFLQRCTTYKEISRFFVAMAHPGNISGAQATIFNHVAKLAAIKASDLTHISSSFLKCAEAYVLSSLRTFGWPCSGTNLR